MINKTIAPKCPEFSPTTLRNLRERLGRVGSGNRSKKDRHFSASQTNIAKMVGVSVDTYQRWESGRLIPRPASWFFVWSTLTKVAEEHSLENGDEPTFLEI